MRRKWPLRSMFAMTFAVAVVGIVCFPPWVVKNHTDTLRVGWGTPLGPRLSEVASAAPNCGGPVAEARENYLAAQRQDQQEKESAETFERMRAEASEAVKRLRARGIDPTKYDTEGTPVHCEKSGFGESCDRLSAYTESGAESPFPSSDRAPSALSQLQAAKARCNNQVNLLSHEAHVDFAMLTYELVAATVLGGVLLFVLTQMEKGARRA